MKKLISLICIIAISCSSSKNIAQTNIQRVWMLTEFQSFTKEYLIEKKATLNLTDLKNASASMGCNGLSFPYKITGDTTITFSSGMSTQMHCEDMKLEREFSKEIIKIATYKIKGHQLFLTSENGNKMVFVSQDWD